MIDLFIAGIFLIVSFVIIGVIVLSIYYQHRTKYNRSAAIPFLDSIIEKINTNKILLVPQTDFRYYDNRVGLTFDYSPITETICVYLGSEFLYEICRDKNPNYYNILLELTYNKNAKLKQNLLYSKQQEVLDKLDNL